jgi:hypothetical protein
MAFDEYPDERGLPYVIAFFYSLAVALFWPAAFAIRRATRFLRELGADSWPRGNGSITGGDVKVVHGWVVDYALSRLDYNYRAAGEYYAGSITRQYPDEQAAWDFVDARRGKHIVARYKDDNAQVSVLLDTDQEHSWNNGNEPRLLASLRQHWRDELRNVPPVGLEDVDPAADEDEEDGNPQASKQ